MGRLSKGACGDQLSKCFTDAAVIGIIQAEGIDAVYMVSIFLSYD